MTVLVQGGQPRGLRGERVGPHVDVIVDIYSLAQLEETGVACVHRGVPTPESTSTLTAPSRFPGRPHHSLTVLASSLI